MATITLQNNHGSFAVDAGVLDEALRSTYGSADPNYVRSVAAGHMGYDPNWLGIYGDQLRDCSRTEVLIMWVESGNHPFKVAD